MRPRASSARLSIKTTFTNNIREWRPPRDPTPRYRSSFPACANPDIPPVPPLSYWEADTPDTPNDSNVSKLNVSASYPQIGSSVSGSGDACELTTVSPSIYSPSPISPSVYSPTPISASAYSPCPNSASVYSPNLWSPSSVYSTPSPHIAAASPTNDTRWSSTNSSSSTVVSSASSTASLSSVSTTASTAPSSTSGSFSHKRASSKAQSIRIPCAMGSPILSPLLSPRYMCPRSPPAVPARASTVASIVPPPSSIPTVCYESIVDGAEYSGVPKSRSTVGWSDIASPIRLDFNLGLYNAQGERTLGSLSETVEDARERPMSNNASRAKGEQSDGEELKSRESVGTGTGLGLGRTSMFFKSEMVIGRTTKAAKRVKSMWSLRGRDSMVVA